MEPRHVDALLIGGGVAAARCARGLRRGGFDGSIVLVGEEASPPYNRPPLSKELLRDDLPAELVLAEPAGWYERHGVELLLGTPATLLDPGERLLELADGRRLQYGRALLATGAAPRRPRVPGAGHALLLRTLDDAATIRARAVPHEAAVVVGGGFIGVEVAASLAARGMRVTVLEIADALWAGTLGRTLSDWALAGLAEAGVAVRFGVACESIARDGVVASGERLAAHLVVAGVGVRPRDELAARAGVLCRDGVEVDGAHATSQRGLWAAGDVARVDGVRVEHWHAAREGGARAAAAMVGASLPDRRAPWVYSDFADRHLDVLGVAPPDAVPEVIGEPGSARFAVAWIGPAGGVAQLAVTGNAIAPEAARRLVETDADVAEVRRALVA